MRLPSRLRSVRQKCERAYPRVAIGTRVVLVAEDGSGAGNESMYVVGVGQTRVPASSSENSAWIRIRSYDLARRRKGAVVVEGAVPWGAYPGPAAFVRWSERHAARLGAQQQMNDRFDRLRQRLDALEKTAKKILDRKTKAQQRRSKKDKRPCKRAS